MKPLQDKRLIRSLLLLSWPILLLSLGVWLWVSFELPQMGAPSAITNKIAEPEPIGLRRLFDHSYLKSFKAAYVSNNPYYYPVPAPPPPPPGIIPGLPLPCPAEQQHRHHQRLQQSPTSCTTKASLRRRMEISLFI